MQQASVKKLCVICGRDVGGESRVKDSAGRYHCEPCWSDHSNRISKSTATSDSTAAESDGDLIPFADVPAPKRVSSPQSGRDPARAIIRSSRDRTSGSRQPPSGPEDDLSHNGRELPDHLAAIAKWERRLLWALIISVLPPFCFLLIPLNLYVTFKLARAMGKNGALWAAGTIVPYAGLLVLIILNVQATGVLKAAGLHAPAFGRWRRRA